MEGSRIHTFARVYTRPRLEYSLNFCPYSRRESKSIWALIACALQRRTSRTGARGIYIPAFFKGSAYRSASQERLSSPPCVWRALRSLEQRRWNNRLNLAARGFHWDKGLATFRSLIVAFMFGWTGEKRRRFFFRLCRGVRRGWKMSIGDLQGLQRFNGHGMPLNRARLGRNKLDDGDLCIYVLNIWLEGFKVFWS